jgi:glutamine synthetase
MLLFPPISEWKGLSLVFSIKLLSEKLAKLLLLLLCWGDTNRSQKVRVPNQHFLS